jgi:hypothetical protein
MCYRPAMRKSLLLLAFCLAVQAGGALAQMVLTRALPTNAERGKLGAQQAYPNVAIGSGVLQLTPGARIYDQNNRTILHGQLPVGSEILYMRNPAGAVQVIYILTDQEIAGLPR